MGLTSADRTYRIFERIAGQVSPAGAAEMSDPYEAFFKECEALSKSWAPQTGSDMFGHLIIALTYFYTVRAQGRDLHEFLQGEILGGSMEEAIATRLQPP
jgi:hypothetical protein